MKINRVNLRKTSIVATATFAITSAVLRITHSQGVNTLLFIALLCFNFTTSLKFFKKSNPLKHRL